MAICWVQFNKQHLGLAHNFEVNPLSCGNHKHYEDYLKYIAITDKKSGKGYTHLIIDTNDTNDINTCSKIVGFVTLKANSLIMKDNDTIIGRSAVEITELAISKEYQGKGFGHQLIDLVLSVADDLRQNYIGIEFIVAVSDQMSESFYTHMEFEKLSDYFDIPRENWNVNCIPMLLRLPEL